MKNTFLLLLILFVATAVVAQKEKEISINNAQGKLSGTLLLPKTKAKTPVVLIIVGSGATDRNGNQGMVQPNTLKLIAEGLLTHNIASLRYDKQGVGKSSDASKPENELVFDDFVEDALLWVNFLKKQKKISEIILLGHSEGALIAKLAAQQDSSIAKVISIAGTGRTIDEVLREQLSDQTEEIQAETNRILEALKEGRTTTTQHKELEGLFRESVQPYLISWIKHQPTEIIKSLLQPVLVIQGTTDIQVKTKDAKLLHEASKQSTLYLIEGMNHVLKDAPEERNANIQTYMNPKLPLSDGLIEKIVAFIKE